MKKFIFYFATTTIATLLISIIGIHRLTAGSNVLASSTLCLSGGPGSTSCGNGLYATCEVSCAPGYYACCNITSCFCVYDGITNIDNDDEDEETENLGKNPGVH